MSRIDDDTVVDLLKSSVGEPPYPPDRYERIVATARKQHRRSSQTLGSLCVGLAVLGSVVAIDRQGSPTLGDPVTVLVAAAGKAEDIGTAHMAGAMTFDTVGITSTSTFTGAIDFRTGRGSMTMNLSLPGAPATESTIVYDGQNAYTPLPDGLDAARAAGKRWIRTDFSKLMAGSPVSADPRSMLDSLKSVSSDVRAVGRDRVRGVRATHYAYTLDTSKAPGGVGGPLGMADVVSGAWIDDDGLVRRLRMDIDMSKAMAAMGLPAEAAQKATMTMSMEFFDYGEPVDVTIPPASEVIDADDPLIEQEGAGCIQAKLQQLTADLAAKMKAGEKPDMTALMEKAAADCAATT